MVVQGCCRAGHLCPSISTNPHDGPIHQMVTLEKTCGQRSGVLCGMSGARWRCLLLSGRAGYADVRMRFAVLTAVEPAEESIKVLSATKRDMQKPQTTVLQIFLHYKEYQVLTQSPRTGTVRMVVDMWKQRSLRLSPRPACGKNLEKY